MLAYEVVQLYRQIVMLLVGKKKKMTITDMVQNSMIKKLTFNLRRVMSYNIARQPKLLIS